VAKVKLIKRTGENAGGKYVEFQYPGRRITYVAQQAKGSPQVVRNWNVFRVAPGPKGTLRTLATTLYRPYAVFLAKYACHWEV